MSNQESKMVEPPDWLDRVDAFRLPNPGEGMFVRPQARQSATRAYRAIYTEKFLIKMDPAARRTVWKRLLTITNRYWGDKAYDDRKSLAKIKEELEGLRKALALTLDELHSLSLDSKHALNEKRIWDTHSREYVNVVEETNASVSDLKQTADSIAALHKEKGKSFAVRNCCSALWDLREQITGQPFKRVYARARGAHRDGKAGERFVEGDARYVQIVMTAIDPKVPLKTIRTKLMEVADEKPKGPSNGNPGTPKGWISGL